MAQVWWDMPQLCSPVIQTSSDACSSHLHVWYDKVHYDSLRMHFNTPEAQEAVQHGTSIDTVGG
jgi:hypothetical protein